MADRLDAILRGVSSPYLIRLFRSTWSYLPLEDRITFKLVCRGITDFPAVFSWPELEDTAGMCHKTYLFYSDRLLVGRNVDYGRSVVAHETAHLLLGHTQKAIRAQDAETEVARQLCAWGLATPEVRMCIAYGIDLLNARGELAPQKAFVEWLDGLCQELDRLCNE